MLEKLIFDTQKIKSCMIRAVTKMGAEELFSLYFFVDRICNVYLASNHIILRKNLNVKEYIHQKGFFSLKTLLSYA